MNKSKLYFAVSICITLFLASKRSTTANLDSNSKWTTCEARDSPTCNCTSEVVINVIARCHFSHVTDLTLIIDAPHNVLRLNISKNNIKEISVDAFQNYSVLVYLSLASNNIKTISKGAFSGLNRLRELNLQDNMIQHWDTTLIHQDLPNLIMLNIAQNMYWKPDQQILSLPNLKVIYLIFQLYDPFLRRPFRCSVIRRSKKIHHGNFSFNDTFLTQIKEDLKPPILLYNTNDCEHVKVEFRDANFWGVMKKSDFHIHCEILRLNDAAKTGNINIKLKQQNQWYYIKRIIWSHCWNLIQKILIITLIEGICAMVFNLIVIITTLRSRVLRESVAHVLVANIAVGDLMFSVYLIAITTTRNSMSAEEYYEFYQPYFCRVVGVFLITGQFSSPLMSFIMTLERYLAVVYCMRPHIRITRRMCYVAMATVWSLTFLLAVCFMNSPTFSRSSDSMCFPISNTDRIKVFQYLCGIGVLLYIPVIALYVHMYLDFQKTNQKTVQLQRENRLARRIALIMFTNVSFFILPLIAIATIPGIHSISKVNRYVFLKTFGVTCLGFNSCLNPILFSFRNGMFRGEFKKRCFLWHAVGPTSSLS